MSPEDYLQKLRCLILDNNETVGGLEYTTGNYDNKGDLIADPIPTITTDKCELGIHGDIIYFTFIILTNDFKKELFDGLSEYQNVQIYLFKDFNNTLYPKADFNYQEFEKQLKNDQYLQINFNDNYKQHSTEEMMQRYLKYKDILSKAGIKPVNQLESDKIKL